MKLMLEFRQLTFDNFM